MDKIARSVITVIVLIVTYYMFTYAVYLLTGLLEMPDNASLVMNILPFVFSAFTAWRFWQLSGKNNLIKISGAAVMKGAVTLGLLSFCTGCFGPLIFMPNANQGPLIGMITGPIGFIVGGICGGLYDYWCKKKRKAEVR